ncbi:hypothetical protein MMC18_006669 [Xylographa bjoerkii]|nr:hypothetical protein [Xylographa bjoerkii]
MASPNPVEETQLDGSCHCSATAFKVLNGPLDAIPDYHPTHSYICSICTRNGYLLIYPLREELEWIHGSEKPKVYRFGTETKEHKLCGECGSSVLVDFMGKHHVEDIVGVNVRIMKGVEVDKLKLDFKDGRNRWGTEYNKRYR